MHTIDPSFILGIAKVSEFGARKYHMRNFLMPPGMTWSDVYGSLMRHLMAFWNGEELDVGPNGEHGPYPDDPEIDMKWSGLPHIDMAAWNMMALCTYAHRSVYKAGDDRPSSLEYKGLNWKEWERQLEEIRWMFSKLPGEERIEYEVKNPSFLKDPLRGEIIKANTQEGTTDQ